MKTKAIILFVGLATLALLATSANAQLVVEEQFDYDVGLLDTLNGGTGFDAPWAATVSHDVRFFAIQGGGLEFGALPIAGRSLSRGGNAGRGEAFRVLSAASLAALTADDTTIWFSMLFAPSAANIGATVIFGSQHLQHTDIHTLPAAGDAFGVTARTTATISAVVFDNSTTAAVTVGSFTPVLQGGASHYDTSLVVGKINWKANGTPDEFFLFNVTDINTEPAEGTAIASITTADLDQSAFDQISITDGTVSIYDEIRFGATFADVTTLGTAGEVIPDPTLVPTKANYSVGESIVLDYTSGTGSATNMIGINTSDQNGPFWDPGLWLFIDGTQTGSSTDVDGQVTFGAGSDGTAAWPLPVGEYIALFFTDETRSVLLATSVTFNVALVGDPDPPTPSITPSSGFPVANETFSLTVPADGTGYQWAFEGGDISGATFNVLTFDPVQESDTGLYEVTYEDGSKATIDLSYFMSVLPSGTTLPLTGLLGLGLLASVCAMGGASVLRRKK